jgi:hypothetical protein
MSHARVESSVPRHPKFLRAGPAASWLWLAGLCYCQDALTDGFISAEAVHTLGVPKPLPLASVLVKERLWQEEPDGWRIHDYLQHNNSAEYINRVRQERKSAGQKGGRSRHPLIKAVNQLDKQVASDLLEHIPESLLKPPLRSSNNVNGSGTTISGTDERQERALARTHSLNGVEIRMARRLRSRETTNGKPAVRVITALARHILAESPDLDEGELMERVKRGCARANLEYAGSVGAAIDRARAQLAKRHKHEATG